MSENNPNKEEKRNAILTAGVSASLKPEMPDSIRVALSVKQNFALAAEEIFCHALNRTIWVYRNDYSAIDLMLAEIRNTAMESMATEGGISRISDMVFKNDAMREFLFTLQAQFYSQFAEFHQHWVDLVTNLAASLTNSPLGGQNIKTEMSLVPEDLRLRTHSAQHMTDLLLANTWFIMFIFISLWGRTFTYEELKANFRRSNAIPG